MDKTPACARCRSLLGEGPGFERPAKGRDDLCYECAMFYFDGPVPDPGDGARLREQAADVSVSVTDHGSL